MRSEFQFIENLKSKYSLDKIGDDCAILPKDARTDLLLTADLLVEDIDFRLEWTTPELIGAKALAVSLSDIAAMGGEPKWAMLSIGIPEYEWDGEFVDRFYEGWFTLARHHHVELVGGDVSRTPQKIVIDSIVGGEIRKGKAILRSGAKVGDHIFVTGQLGGAAGGLMLLEAGFHYSGSNRKRQELITRQLRPTPQLTIGKYLSLHNLASSMIDLSDGLSSDLTHLCCASIVGARIEADKLPIHPNLSEIPNPPTALDSGEDFELLFTVPPSKISKITSLHATYIGEITSKQGIVEVIDTDGNIWTIPAGGYWHF